MATQLPSKQSQAVSSISMSQIKSLSSGALSQHGCQAKAFVPKSTEAKPPEAGEEEDIVVHRMEMDPYQKARSPPVFCGDEAGKSTLVRPSATFTHTGASPSPLPDGNAFPNALTPLSAG